MISVNDITDMQKLRCAASILCNINPDDSEVIDTGKYIETMELLHGWRTELEEKIYAENKQDKE